MKEAAAIPMAVPGAIQWCEWFVGTIEAAYVIQALYSSEYTFDGLVLVCTLGVLLLAFLPSSCGGKHKDRFLPLWTSCCVPVGSLCIPMCLLALLTRHAKNLDGFLCSTTVYAHTLSVYARIALVNASSFAIVRRVFFALHPAFMCVIGAAISTATAVFALQIEERLAIIGSFAFFATVFILAVHIGDVSFSLGDLVTISHITSTLLVHFSCLPAFVPKGFRIAQLFDYGLLKSEETLTVYTSWTLKTETIACIVTVVITMLFVLLCCLVPKKSGIMNIIGVAIVCCICMGAIHIVFDNYSNEHYGIIEWTVEMLFVQHIKDSVGAARIVLFFVYIFILVIGFFIMYVSLSTFEGDVASNHDSEDEEDEEDDVTVAGEGEKEEKQKENESNDKKDEQKPSSLWRKYFHLMALLMFVPGLIFEPTMVYLPVTYVTCGFIVLECLRSCLGSRSVALSFVSNFYSMFTGDQDHGMITTTHICLLAGIVLPCWLSQCASAPVHWLAPYSGLVVVGVGDAAAHIFGKLFGNHKWLHCSKKSIEGTVLGILCSLWFVILLWLFNGTPRPFVYRQRQVYIAVIGSMLQEAFITQIDNLALPLHFFVFLVTPLPYWN